MYTYLSQDKPNRGRQPELDLAKCIAIFLMIACHCGIYFLEEGTAAFFVFDMLGGEFTAPAFMVCMGIGVVFSHHNQPQLLIKRGGRIMIYGYLLNFIRATIPEIIIGFIDPSKQYFGLAISFYMVDILPFAGLAMILMGIFKKLKVEPVYQLMLGILMAGLGDVLAYVSTGHEWLDAVCGLIWGTSEWSFFPLLNWFVFPAAGVFLGEILMHCNDKAALYKRLLPIGLFGVALSYYMAFTEPSYYSNGSYYFMGIQNVILGLCFPMLLFSLCYFITEKSKISNNSFVLFSSKNLNSLYCISWVVIFLIFYYVLILGGLEITPLSFSLLMVAVFVLSYGTCLVWQIVKKRRAEKKALAG